MSTLKVDIYFKQEMEKFLNLKTTSHAILIQCFVWDMGGEIQRIWHCQICTVPGKKGSSVQNFV